MFRQVDALLVGHLRQHGEGFVPVGRTITNGEDVIFIPNP